ncbi:MAG: PEP-CTERM sorting domain-containing protein [Candidatus Omnitrophota bacterium]
MNKKTTLLSLLFAGLLLLAMPALSYAGVGGPHLWLSTDPAQFDEGGAGYVYDSSDPWKADSYVPEQVPFTMYLYNSLNNGKFPDALNIGLLVTIHNGEAGSVNIKDEFGVTTTLSVFNLTDFETYYGGGNHGVYAPHDGVFAIYHPSSVINLSSNSTGKKYTSFEIEGISFSQVHFDAFSDNGYYNPASHDVTDRTKTPEPSTIALLGIGLFGLFGARKKRGR